MTDAIIVSDRGNVFESLFSGHGMTCMQVTPAALGSPFCPPCKLLIMPSGFADPKYYKVLPAIERNAEKIRSFLERGGIVLAFGAMLTDYTYDWLPGKLSYHMKFKEMDVKIISPADPAASLVLQGKQDCDGYFTEWETASVIMADAENRPVVISKKVGKGYFVAAALHQWPSEKFLQWACSDSKEELTI